MCGLLFESMAMDVNLPPVLSMVAVAQYDEEAPL